MKKFLTVVFTGILFLIIVVAILFKVFNPKESTEVTKEGSPFESSVVHTTPTSQNTPEEVSNTCFTLYVRAYTTSNFSLTDEVNDPNLKECFTDEFRNNWEKIGEQTESDPILLSQDYLLSWNNPIKTTLINQNLTQSTVAVSIGTGSETKNLIAHVILDNTWKIDSVTAE